MTKKKSENDTKSHIIQAARKIFAEKGYDHTKISEIAKNAGLSDGALYEYFKGKEDLLLAIPERFVRDGKKEFNDNMFGLEGSFIKLRKFVWWFFKYVEENPETASVVFLYLKTNRNFMKAEVYSDVRDLFSLILQIFKEGIERGEIKPDLDPIIARGIVMGTLEYVIINWLLKDKSFSLFDKVDQIYKCLVDALKAPKE